jgi:hypothetical protein
VGQRIGLAWQFKSDIMMEKKEKVHKRLSVAELKNCKGFENYTDEEAEMCISILEKLAIMFYELYISSKQKKNKFIEKQTDNESSEQRKAA